MSELLVRIGEYEDYPWDYVLYKEVEKKLILGTPLSIFNGFESNHDFKINKITSEYVQFRNDDGDHGYIVKHKKLSVINWYVEKRYKELYD